MEKPFALIIEDERDVAALFRHVLDIAGYHTEIAMDGREAVRRLESARPDIVLLDLNLPGVPGAKILEQIRADQRLESIPVVVITGHSEVAVSLPVEPDLILFKPVNLDQLSNLVQRLRNTPGSMREKPWDEPTHLYNQSFFDVRLAYSLERAKQIKGIRFGVLFADLVPFSTLRRSLYENQLNVFLRQVAERLKATLRPTDTIARIEDAFFLILIDDIANEDIPCRIAARLQIDLGNYLSQKQPGMNVRAYVGVLLCDAEYATAPEIMRDVELARELNRSEGENVLYDREILRRRRISLGKF
jgi:diguanylate cyclase (GGDEF)-like protein